MPQEQITKALTLGASELQLVYRIVLPQVMPRLIDTVRLSLGGGVAVPDRGRGHRLHRRPGLPHLPGAALPRHGRDHPLRAVDHAARLCHRLVAQARAAPPLPVVPARDHAEQLPSLRQEPAAHRERLQALRHAAWCSTISICRWRKASCAPWSGRAAAASRRCCASSSARSSRIGRRRLHRRARRSAMPDATRGIVYQKYSLFPHLTVLDNVLLGKVLEIQHLRAPARAGASIATKPCNMLERARIGEHCGQVPATSSPAACSSASRSRRRSS